MSTVPTRPSDRYPDERSRFLSRRVALIGLVVVVILGIGIAWLGYQKFARQPVSAEMAGYSIVSPSAMEVQVSVTRTDPSVPVSCIIRAKNKAGDEIGRREFYVPASTETVVVVSSTVTTTEPPVVGDAFGCGTAIPAYLDRA